MYRGDSYGKRVARPFFWRTVQRMLGDRFFLGKHLVLASKDGGDIRQLLSMGILPSDIVAVDLDASAIDECRRLFPDISYEQGDVAEVVRRYKRSLRSAYLDFCGPWGSKIRETSESVLLAGMGDRSVIGLTFMAGREKGVDREATMEFKEDLERVIGELQAFDTMSPRDRSRVVTALSRGMQVDQGWFMMCLRYKTAVIPKATVVYRSTTTMITKVGRVVRANPSWKLKRFRRFVGDRMEAMSSPDFRLCRVVTEADFAMHVVLYCEQLSELRPTLPASEVNRIAADEYNVSAGTIRAWKAHSTRRHGGLIREVMLENGIRPAPVLAVFPGVP